MTNRFITLVRHAKSDPKVPGQSDHDRTLSTRGERDASTLASRMVARGCIPDLILCSSAVRTRQTAHFLMQAFAMGDDTLRVDRQLYLCTPDTLLDRLACVEHGPNHIMIIGHNPGLEQLSTLMSPLCNPHMPTMGIRHFGCVSLHNITLASQYQQPDSNLENSAEPVIELLFEDFPTHTWSLADGP